MDPDSVLFLLALLPVAFLSSTWGIVTFFRSHAGLPFCTLPRPTQGLRCTPPPPHPTVPHACPVSVSISHCLYLSSSPTRWEAPAELTWSLPLLTRWPCLFSWRSVTCGVSRASLVWLVKVIFHLIATTLPNICCLFVVWFCGKNHVLCFSFITNTGSY